MFLHNPAQGATIKDIWIDDEFYFDSKKQEEFSPGEVIQIKESVGQYLKTLYDFLEEVTEEQAKKIIEDVRKQGAVCDKCNFVAANKNALSLHMRKHETRKVDGIRMIESEKTEESIDKTPEQVQKEIDSEGKKEGLTIGEGLVNDAIPRTAQF